jgi:DNA-binding CsgD family transcriptional regulator
VVLASTAAGRYADAATAALDGEVDARRAGLTASSAAYLAGAGAESLVRLGRWPEADTVLRGMEGIEAIPIAASRLATARALLAARRGDHDGAAVASQAALQAPVGAFHDVLAHTAAAEAFLAIGRWGDALMAIDHATLRDGPVTASRAAMIRAIAETEITLDSRAGRAVDTIAVTGRPPAIDSPNTPVEAAELAHTRATLTLLGAPDPDAWAVAVGAWRDAADPWSGALALTHEAEAAARLGAAARASEALQDAHQTAVTLGAGGLIARIEAVARAARLSVEVAELPELGDDAAVRLGLTAREIEVLALVAAGRTNREIGGSLFVAEKTASVHVSNILRKLGVHSRVEAAAIAQRAGMQDV